MNIQKINRNIYTNKLGTKVNSTNNDTKTPITTNVLSTNQIPTYAIKSNFIPNFGKYRKVANVILKDRDTENNVVASLRKEQIGDYLFYKVFVNNKEAGYMNMNCSSLFPEDNFVITETDSIIPEITHLRSLMGDKYAGIGTALVNAAVGESIKRGKGGALWLKATQGFAHTLSDYRSNENPIPFYYKMGFRAVNPQMDKFIQECIKKTEYDKLPVHQILLLSSDAVNQKNKYLAQNFAYV